LAQRRQGAFEIADEGRLGDFEFQPVSGHSRPEQDLMHLMGKIHVVKLDCRYVHGDPQGACPSRRLGACRPQDPLADLKDRAAVLGHRNEYGRRYGAAGAMLPAQQRLETGDLVGFDVRLRLVHEAQLAT
jgi:hypothetical protein